MAKLISILEKKHGGRGGIWTPGFNDANVAIFQADLPAHWHFKPYKNAIKRYGKINSAFLILIVSFLAPKETET